MGKLEAVLELYATKDTKMDEVSHARRPLYQRNTETIDSMNEELKKVHEIIKVKTLDFTEKWKNFQIEHMVPVS